MFTSIGTIGDCDFLRYMDIVPDHGSRDCDVVLVKAHNLFGKTLGGSGIWNGEGMGRGRSVYEQPGTKVDGIASRQRRVSK